MLLDVDTYSDATLHDDRCYLTQIDDLEIKNDMLTKSLESIRVITSVLSERIEIGAANSHEIKATISAIEALARKD